ncbi:MAG TPA: hypothetical protein VLK36_06760 [Gaiellaceae bacterium]|nr:hypothetical protein [Gaiellaceae bacterium]
MKALGVATLVAVIALTGSADAAVESTATLKGATQISFGCPGPVSDSGPACYPWHPYPSARFAISRRTTAGLPVPNTAVVVTSNQNGRFSLRLSPGSYRVTPLPGRNTHGGPPLTVRLRAGAATTVLVRFVGFPQME